MFRVFELKMLLWAVVALFSASSAMAQLSINEVQTSNDSTLADGAGEFDDWIEIYNAGGSVDLAGYYISDDPTDPLKYQIPAGTPARTTVPANGFRILWADDDEAQGADHLSFNLSSGGETILLSDPNEVLVSSMVVPALATDTSRGRSPDGGALQQVFASPSPNASNGNGVPQAAAPVITPASSVRSGSFTVSINIPAGTTIRYTIDGSDPVTDGQAYSGPFSVTDDAVVRAIGRRNGYADSPEDFASYLVNPPHDIAMVMVTTDPDNLYDPQFGIYTDGANGTTGPCELNPKNYNQDWQRPGNIVMFEANGTVAFSETCELEISGGCSRRDVKKSLNIGFDNPINYQLFPSQPHTKWRGLKLRTGGNKRTTTRIGDAFVQTLFENELDIDQQAYRPTVLYLNGEYWGYYSIRDRLNHDYIKTYHPAASKDVDLIKHPGSPGIRHWISEEVKEGTNEDYADFTQFLNNTDFTVPANYEAARERLDLDSFMDYGLVQVYHRNADWPGNNMRAWRERSPFGRWRYMLSDTGDFLNSSVAADTTLFTEVFVTGGDPNNQRNPTDTLPYRKLSLNQDFRNEFAQRTATYVSTFWSSASVNAKMQELMPEIASEMDRDAARWSGYQGTTSWTSSMNELPQFYAAREEVFRSSVQNHFLGGVNDRFGLTVNFNASQGQVVLHSNHFKIQSGHSGDYYRNVPIRTFAVAKPGHRFLNWEGFGNVVDRVNPGLNRSYSFNVAIEAIFEPGALDLVATEVHYNPADTNAAEFVELHNPDSHAKYIGGHSFTNGLRFTFPSDAVIAPGEYIVIAREPARYEGNGYQVFGPFGGALNDGGETLALATPFGDSVFVTEYNDGSDWPQRADGMGASLELVSPSSDPALPSSWQASYVIGGTPGAPNSSPSGVVINEIMARSGNDWVELLNLTGSAVDIGGWFLSNDISALSRYQIPSGTVIAAGGWRRFTQSQLGFGLGDDGTVVVLSRGLLGFPVGLEDLQDLSAGMPNQSRGRHVRSDGLVAFPPQTAATPSAANSAPFASPVRMTELMIEPQIGKGEYIKLTNVSGLPVDLFDPANAAPWALSGAIEFPFPLLTSIAACESIYVTSENPATFKVQYGLPFSAKVFGPWTGKLNNGGESIKMRRPAPALPDGTVPMALVEKVRYYDSSAWPVAPLGSVLKRQPGSGYSGDPATWSVAAPGSAFPCENFPPDLAAPAAISIPEQSAFQQVLSASDPEGDSFGFSLSPNAPAGAAISQTGLFTWTPSNAQGPGVYTFDVIVTEFSAVPRTDQESWTITVLDVNDPPVLTVPGTVTIPEEALFQTTLTATDPEGDPLAFSLSGAPAGATISPSGAFSWTPSDAQGGASYTFEVVVRESNVSAEEDRRNWTIIVDDVNDPPVLGAVSHAATLTEHAVWTWQMPAATDPEGGAITLQLSGGVPSGLVLDPASGWLRWQPGESTGGTAPQFQIIASDPEGATAAMNINLTVLERTPPPVPNTPCNVPTELVASGSSWRWSQSDVSASLWSEPWLDDSAWASGAAPLGFNNGNEATTLPGGVARSTFRHSFQASDVEAVTSLTLEVARDDGFVAYLNGVEIARDNLPAGALSSTTLASSSVFGGAEQQFNQFNIPTSFLAEGDNTLAVAVHQVAANSNDMTFELRLQATGLADCTPLVMDVKRLRNDGIISWSADPGSSYQVEVCEDLVVGVWTPIATVTATAPVAETTDPAANPEQRRFYRIRRMP